MATDCVIDALPAQTRTESAGSARRGARWCLRAARRGPVVWSPVCHGSCPHLVCVRAHATAAALLAHLPFVPPRALLHLTLATVREAGADLFTHERNGSFSRSPSQCEESQAPSARLHVRPSLQTPPSWPVRRTGRSPVRSRGRGGKVSAAARR